MRALAALACCCYSNILFPWFRRAGALLVSISPAIGEPIHMFTTFPCGPPSKALVCNSSFSNAVGILSGAPPPGPVVSVLRLSDIIITTFKENNVDLRSVPATFRVECVC